MGQAVAERTVLRKTSGGYESWEDVAVRVAAGNVSLAPGGLLENTEEFQELGNHIAEGRILMSGRHLQHGDLDQKNRNMEVFTNCATAPTSTLSYYNLLNGAGVGRCYDDDMMMVDWDKAPQLVFWLLDTHPDYQPDLNEISPHGHRSPKVVLHTVHDSREGWAKALEIYETMTYLGQSDKVLVLDFSNIRPSGSPIGGMQGRPSCGPVPTMEAFKNVRDTVVGKGWPMWKQAMWVDHYFAESVLVGGARRAARIATKYWRDPDILEFVKIKQGGVLWSANNSVGVDKGFWEGVHAARNAHAELREIGFHHPVEVFDAITHASYHDGTGEPGFLNLHKLNTNEEGWDWEELKKGEYVGSKKYQVEDDYKSLLGDIAARVENKEHKFIVNPCGEIVLSVLGGFCVIGDVVPYFCENGIEFRNALRHTTRALIRVNTMDSIYKEEVQRTNRIGVGLTGLHEYAFSTFGLCFRDLINMLDGWSPASYFWDTLAQVRRYDCVGEAERYSKELGLPTPLTVTTIKPAGTTSKLFGLTEGCHLPAMDYYLRWVQKRTDDPLVKKYADRGYLTKELKTYKGMTAVGFPTKPLITKLIPEDQLVTAGEATMDEQFRWLELLEEHWLGPDRGNQISYTLKYDPEKVSYEEFREKMLRVAGIRCVSVMPQIDATAYEYQPEEPITEERYNELMSKIQVTDEDISREHLECGAGGCPVDFNEGDK